MHDTEQGFMDADGKTLVQGSSIRLRLSYLTEYNVPKGERHGTLEGATEQAVIAIGAGKFVVPFDAIRRNPVQDTPAPPDPVATITDADGKIKAVGSKARVRLSRLTSFHVTKATRHGYVAGSMENGSIVLQLDKMAVILGTSDFRWD